MKTYSEKLKDPRWQRKRLDILERDEFTCRYCRTKDKTLHVHHKIYRKGKMPWDYEDEVFVTLCEECHSEAEERKNRILMKLGQNRKFDAELHLIAGAMRPNSGYADLTYWGWVAEKLAACVRDQYYMLRPSESNTPSDAYWAGLESFAELQESITDAQRHFKKLYEDCHNEL